MTPGNWSDTNARVVGLMLSDDGTRLFILASAYHRPLSFTLPTTDVSAWTVRIDAGTGEIDPPDRRFAPGSQIELGGRSLLVLAGEIG